MSNTKEILFRGRVERYSVEDGMEMFMGYVHRATSPAELAAAEQRTLDYYANRLTRGEMFRL